MDIVARWTGWHACALRDALRLTNEAFANHLGVAVRTVAKWGDQYDLVPTPALQQVLDVALSQASEPAKLRFALLIEQAAGVRQGNHRSIGVREPDQALNVLTRGDPTGSGEDLGGSFMSAAHESASNAVLHSAEVSTDAIAELHEQVVSTARGYPSQRPFNVFLEVRRVRDLACRLAEQTHRPSDLADLYVITGQANALMASVAFDLGHWDAAKSLTRSAATYADLAGNTHLHAWTYGLQGTLANWRDHPETALERLARGLAIAPPGAPRFRLRHIAARAHALRGDASSTAAALDSARGDREIAEERHDPLQDGIGGEFAFDDARAAACVGAAWLCLGDGEQAERHAQFARDNYANTPAEHRPFSPANGVQIDLATARLLSGDCEGAEHYLMPVFGLDPALRNVALSGRLGTVQKILIRFDRGREPRARELAARISDWKMDTAARPLPADDVS